jgi:hypothetical protein
MLSDEAERGEPDKIVQPLLPKLQNFNSKGVNFSGEIEKVQTLLPAERLRTRKKKYNVPVGLGKLTFGI